MSQAGHIIRRKDLEKKAMLLQMTSKNKLLPNYKYCQKLCLVCVCVLMCKKRRGGGEGWAYLQQPIASTMEGGDD